MSSSMLRGFAQQLRIALVALVLIVCFVSCGSSGQASLAPLQIKGIVRVSAVDHLHLGGLGDRGSLAAYTSADGARILLAVEEAVFNVPLTTGPTTLYHTIGNCASLAVAPLGQWAACDNQVFRTDGAGPVYTLQPVPGQSVMNGVVWSVDGSMLITLTHNSPSGACQLVFYRFATQLASGDTLAPSAVATISGLNVPCLGLAISPDGAELALNARDFPVNKNVWLLPTSPLFAQVQHAITIGSSQSISLSANQFEPLPISTEQEPVSWEPGTDWLTFIPYNISAIEQYNLKTHQLRTLLAFPSDRACSISWTPDGDHLVFIYCHPGGGDLGGPPLQVYTFTPSHG